MGMRTNSTRVLHERHAIVMLYTIVDLTFSIIHNSRISVIFNRYSPSPVLAECIGVAFLATFVIPTK